MLVDREWLLEENGSFSSARSSAIGKKPEPIKMTA
jgi:hypothetical protein